MVFHILSANENMLMCLFSFESFYAFEFLIEICFLNILNIETICK